MAQKTALITGITGQDGAYLTQLLLDKGYTVHGLQRRTSSHNTGRIDAYLTDVTLHQGDMTDGGNLTRIINETQPDEIYNLAAQSHVGTSFDAPEYTANTDALGTLRILEAIRTLKLHDKTRFYQASSSELFGNATTSPQDETTAFQPQSPYATAKLFAYWTTVNYRDAYGIHASNGILFNHESPLRGEDFVTRKITQAVARIATGQQDMLYLGNLNAKRDWGHARDYVQGMWHIIQHTTPDDYVLATGQTHSVRTFADLAFKAANITLSWQGQGVDETAINAATGQTVIRIDPQLFRPNEVHTLCGNATKAHTTLGWRATTSLQSLVTEMVEAGLREATA